MVLYKTLLRWHADDIRKTTVVYKPLICQGSWPVAWFPKETSNAWREGDRDSMEKWRGNTYQLKDSSCDRKLKI